MSEEMRQANSDRRAELSRGEEALLPQVENAMEAIQYVFGDVLLKQKLNGEEQAELFGLKIQLMTIKRHMQTRPPNRATEEDVAKTINAVKGALAKVIPKELRMFDLDSPMF